MSSTLEIRQWEEAPVDQTKEHFEICYGSSSSDWELWPAVALIGPPLDGTVSVQLVLPYGYARRIKIILEVVKEIEYYLLEKQEDDPWGYAQHHCGTAANCYGSVHWSFFKPDASVRGETVPPLTGAVILEVGAEGGSIALLGNRDEKGEWYLFWLRTNEAAAIGALSEEDRAGIDRDSVTDAMSQTVSQAMVLLSEYEWFALQPLQVRPEFRKLIQSEVCTQGGPSEAMRWSGYFREWEAAEWRSQNSIV